MLVERGFRAALFSLHTSECVCDILLHDSLLQVAKLFCHTQTLWRNNDNTNNNRLQSSFVH